MALACVTLCAACATSSVRANPQESAVNQERPLPSGAHGFDFYVGRWHVDNRRLRQRHVGSNEWDQFPATITARPILGGLGNFDEIEFPTKGWSGVDVKVYDVEAQHWSNRFIGSGDGKEQPALVGVFKDGVGEFSGDDVDEGRPIRVRTRWTEMTPKSFRWEQAFSTDGGKTWETNWIMDARRIE
jgi:hypothetical protein